jgi:hypothetical protein
MSFRAFYLLSVGAAVFHVAWWQFALIWVGYAICDGLDRRQVSHAKQRTRDAVYADEVEGWESDPHDPLMERKGHLVAGEACRSGTNPCDSGGTIAAANE